MIEAAACISIYALNEVIVRPLDWCPEPGFRSTVCLQSHLWWCLALL